MAYISDARMAVVATPPQHGVKELHGRIMNDLNNIYMLPADDLEMDRLTLQNFTLELLIGGPMPIPNSMLATLLSDPAAAILDIGSGSGIWAAEIAGQFPHANVVGFDLAPGRPTSTPSNCRFVTGDADHDLGQFEGKFNLVHARSVAHGTSDFPRMVRNLVSCLRPGGILVVAGGDLRVYDETKTEITDPAKSDFARLLMEVAAADKSRGLKTQKGDTFHALLERTPGLRDARYRAYYCPIKWGGTQEDGFREGERLGRLMARNAKSFIQAWKPLLLTSGMSEPDVDNLIRRADVELDGPARRLYTRWHYAWAFKST